MKNPEITVIIPTYKRPVLLKKAIDSILSQTFPYFQLIVCDNHSDDETFSVVDSYRKNDSRVAYICHSENIGMMKNYEYGFSLIKTPYFHFLSDDDTVLPHFFSEAMTLFQKHPEIGFYAGSTQIFSSQNEVLRTPHSYWTREGYWPAPQGALEMIGKYPIPTSVVFSQKVLSSVLPDYTNTLHWDCDFLFHVALSFPFYLSKTLSGSFLSQDSSFSQAPSFDLVYESFVKMRNRTEKALIPHPLLKQKVSILLKRDFKLHFRGALLRLFRKQDFDSLKNALPKLEEIYGKDFVLFSFLLPVGRTFPWLCQALPFLQKVKQRSKRLFIAK